MSKYLPIEQPVHAHQIAHTGASGQFVELDNGSVVKLNEIGSIKHTAEVGDFIVITPTHSLLMSAEQFNSAYHKPNLKSHLDAIEEQIESVEFIVRDSLTLCVLRVRGNRFVHGECTRYVKEMCSQEEAEAIAYGNALSQLMRLESYVIQGQESKLDHE